MGKKKRKKLERKGWLKKFLKADAFIIALGLLDKDFIFKEFV
ncbi:MAG: hypothetical protein E7D08_07150 [Peptoniphilus harei]|nr:hypothetical protein [Peptoniphilus harei]